MKTLKKGGTPNFLVPLWNEIFMESNASDDSLTVQEDFKHDVSMEKFSRQKLVKWLMANKFHLCSPFLLTDAPSVGAYTLVAL